MKKLILATFLVVFIFNTPVYLQAGEGAPMPVCQPGHHCPDQD